MKKFKIKKKRIIILAVIILIISISAALVPTVIKKLEPQEDFKPTTVAIVKGNISESFSTSGKIVSATKENVYSEISGELINLNVAIGDTINAGDIICEIKNTSLDIGLKRKENEINLLSKQLNSLRAESNTSLKNTYENAKSAYTTSLKNYSTNQELYESGIISESDLDVLFSQQNRALNDFITAESRLNAYNIPEEISIIETNIEIAQLEMDDIKATLGDKIIVSPIAGTITQLSFDQGELLPTGAMICEIQDTNNLIIETNISEFEINKIVIGQTAKVTLLSDENHEYKATVTQLYPSGEISGQEVSVKTVLTIEDEDALIKPNFTANIEIVVADKDNALLVPYDALIRIPKEGYIVRTPYDMENDFIDIPVQIGIRSDLMVEILSPEIQEDMLVIMANDFNFTNFFEPDERPRGQ